MCGAHVFTCLRSPCLAEGGDGGGTLGFTSPCVTPVCFTVNAGALSLPIGVMEASLKQKHKICRLCPQRGPKEKTVHEVGEYWFTLKTRTVSVTPKAMFTTFYLYLHDARHCSQ